MKLVERLRARVQHETDCGREMFAADLLAAIDRIAELEAALADAIAEAADGNRQLIEDRMALEARVGGLEAEAEELEEALVEALNQGCWHSDGVIDSGALSAYAGGLLLLAQRGRFKIAHQRGRMVAGTWTEKGDEDPHVQTP